MRYDEESAAFRALADPTRRQILRELRDGALAAGEIAARFPISGPSISRHLATLASAGLVGERREANRIYYSLRPDRLVSAVDGFLAAVAPEPPPAPAAHKAKAKGKGKKGAR